MPTINNFFEKLVQVPVHYDRPPLAQYGSKGVSYKFFCEKDFEKKLNKAFDELFSLTSFMEPEVIVSAGTLVHKSGYHGMGRAFDLDGIFWKNRVFITNNYPTDKIFYLGIESIMRKHFGTVLNYNYNKAHHDHLHIDDGTAIGFNADSRSKVLYVQAALTHVLELQVAIDGVYGSETKGAISKALERMNVTGAITSKNVWLHFLTGVANMAFEKEQATMIKEKSPGEMLTELFNLIDHHLKDHPAKKTIESGLIAFANHEEIKKVWDED